jgi:SAM-dependent methyltransferase
MSSLQSDKNFGSSVAKFYDEYFVPLIFEPYAEDIARRLAARRLARVLEIAAGTGVVTRRLASLLPNHVSIVATDLNQPMLDLAAEVGTARPVEWRQADAMQLPFEDGSFDAVVCQFGVMFFPDKAKAFAEARRVLRPGSVFLFNVWDRIEENEFADVITTALESVFPHDPPRFMARTPRLRAASPGRPGYPRWRTARDHRCATRSKRGTSPGSTKRPISRRTPSPDGSDAGKLTARSRHTLSRRNADNDRNDMGAKPLLS